MDGQTTFHRNTPLRALKVKFLPKPHGPIARRWSPLPVALSRTPAEAARPRIRG